MKLKRIYYPYWMWEDYKNGLYETTNVTALEIINYYESKIKKLCLK